MSVYRSKFSNQHGEFTILQRLPGAGWFVAESYEDGDGCLEGLNYWPVLVFALVQHSDGWEELCPVVERDEAPVFFDGRQDIVLVGPGDIVNAQDDSEYQASMPRGKSNCPYRLYIESRSQKIGTRQVA